MIRFDGKFEFGSKAETLERLYALLPEYTIPKSHYFTVQDWLNGSDEIVLDIQSKFDSQYVIVRSSSLFEDGDYAAQAGAFLSIPSVDASISDALRQAINKVIASYDKLDMDCHSPLNQVLIQEMISNVQMSGVIFTQDLATGAPYYVINYDDETGSTDSVTGGNYINRTLYVHRSAHEKVSSRRFSDLLSMVNEIEHLIDDTCLDIEFAIDSQGTVRIFQVRRITSQPNWNRGIELHINDGIRRARELIEMRYCSNVMPDSCYIDTILGNMPDWNPAEMIGTAPRPLALSLYRHLITDRIWRAARQEMGYVERVGIPLMISLMGQPFIDTRESFYSYLPAGLDESIQNKLVESWLMRLRENHHLHDKVEFDIATTTYSLDFDDKVNELFPSTLNDDELNSYRILLKKQTEMHVCGKLASIDLQLDRINELKRRRSTIINTVSSPSLEIVSALLEDAIHFGTLPFAILARHGFIAASLMRSMVDKKIITKEEFSAFQASISTVASEFLVDLERFGECNADLDSFTLKYGHLRPGTYDILSLRYDARDLNKTFGGHDQIAPLHQQGSDFSKSTKKRINKALLKTGFKFDVEILLDYIRRAIKGREYAKFVFTHNLSDALEVLSAWGQQYGLSREELSYINYNRIFDAMVTTKGRSIESHLREESENGRDDYSMTTAIKLPYLITRISDLYIVPLAVDRPNFITRKNICAEVVLVSGASQDPSIIKNKIVLIESADPGFDWIFSSPLAGLITKFGGANSHMAIRCAEFNLPAAIGCGEQLFERARRSKDVDLLCAEGVIKFL